MRTVRLTMATLIALGAISMVRRDRRPGDRPRQRPRGHERLELQAERRAPAAGDPRPRPRRHRRVRTGATSAPRLNAAGYCTFSQTYGLDPRVEAVRCPRRVDQDAGEREELRAFVQRVRAATGAKRVDIVGHSEGTVMPRYYMERLGGAKRVDDFVALTPLWRGTEVGGAAMLRDLGAGFGLASRFSTWSRGSAARARSSSGGRTTSTT